MPAAAKNKVKTMTIISVVAEGTEVSKPIMDAVLDSYSIYDLTKEK